MFNVLLLGFLTRTQSQTRLQKILQDLFPSTQNTEKFQGGKNTIQKGKNTVEQKSESPMREQANRTPKVKFLYDTR